LFLERQPSWLYAPLSRIRALPVRDSATLAANRFPEGALWTEYGIQAAILWAVPFGGEKYAKRRNAVKQWLASAETQDRLAGKIFPIAAHPDAKPYNAVSQFAQFTWQNASLVWVIEP
jgi:hypothetical protein